MSSVVKVALPILGTVIGAMVGGPWGAAAGGALGGYVGGRSYGGGNKGGMVGAAIGGIGGYFGGGGTLSGLGTGGTSAGLGEAGASTFAAQGSQGLYTDAMGQTVSEGATGAGYGASGMIGTEAGASAAQWGGEGMGGQLANMGAGGSGGAGLGGAGSAVTPTLSMSDGGGGSFLEMLKRNPNLVRGGINAGTALMSRMGAGNTDPFGKYRGQYGAELAALEANPSSITSRPGYAAGMQAVERSGAAQGYTGSGNMAFSLANFGQGFYQNEVGRLATLAGAGAPPGQGAVNNYQMDQNTYRGVGAGVGQMMGPG